MRYTLEAARASLRNRAGKRVFYLGPEDELSPEARDYLRREDISVLPAPTGPKPPKEERMTNLNAETLVPKTHPRIFFRGSLDTLEAELLLAQEKACPQLQKDLQEALDMVRRLLRAEVLGEPFPAPILGGLDANDLRAQSQNPQRYLGISHFMPEVSDGSALLRLNKARTAAREAELLCCAAFPEPEGSDLVLALNRLSSFLYLLMLRQKSGYYQKE